mgnify:FL=1|jgi:hypothetical protein
MSCDITTLVDRFRNNVLDVRFMLIVNLENKIVDNMRIKM